jgi:CheY-like chemotaxis protein
MLSTLKIEMPVSSNEQSLIGPKEETRRIEAKNPNNDFSELDNLSHAVRTPLHVLGGYVAGLEKFSQGLSPLKISDPVLRITLFRRSVRLGHYLSTMQAQSELLASGNYVEFFRQTASKESDKLGDSSIAVFTETLASLASHINHLQAAQEKLKKLIYHFKKLNEEELKNQFDEIAIEIQAIVAQIKKDRDNLNEAISPAVSSSVSIQLSGREKESDVKRLRILVVDDIPANQKILKRMLGKQHCCEFASNGKEAVEKYSENTFDIIFMDIQMPVMNGLEAASEIRQQELATHKRRTPIIASTAIDSDTLDKGITVAAGMDGYIMKPYDKKRVREIIHLHTDKGSKIGSESGSDVEDRPSTPTFPNEQRQEKADDFPKRSAASWSTPSDGQKFLTNFHLFRQRKKDNSAQGLLAKSSDIALMPRPLLKSFL